MPWRFVPNLQVVRLVTELVQCESESPGGVVVECVSAAAGAKLANQKVRVLMEHLGRHVIIELWGCNDAINDADRVKTAMLDAVKAANATLLNIYVHTFSPQGVTGVAVLSESHLSIHTWPEHGYVAADVFTCGETTNPKAAAEVLHEAFEATHADIKELTRGVRPTERPHRRVDFKPNRGRKLARV
jgi:S-adenosylmethionine decarboxylase